MKQKAKKMKTAKNILQQNVVGLIFDQSLYNDFLHQNGLFFGSVVVLHCKVILFTKSL